MQRNGQKVWVWIRGTLDGWVSCRMFLVRSIEWPLLLEVLNKCVTLLLRSWISSTDLVTLSKIMRPTYTFCCWNPLLMLLSYSACEWVNVVISPSFRVCVFRSFQINNLLHTLSSCYSKDLFQFCLPLSNTCVHFVITKWCLGRDLGSKPCLLCGCIPCPGHTPSLPQYEEPWNGAMWHVFWLNIRQQADVTQGD